MSKHELSPDSTKGKRLKLDDDSDSDDMFSTKPNRTTTTTAIPVIDRSSSTLVDNFDDDQGYYKLILGELLDQKRYHVHANLGKGMFSNVVRARDLHLKEGDDRAQVAIKIIRSQESM